MQGMVFLMKNEYREANNKIVVSAERKAALLSDLNEAMMKPSAKLKTPVQWRKFAAFVVCLLFLFGTGTVIVLLQTQRPAVQPNPAGQTKPSNQKGDVYFNVLAAPIDWAKIPMFEVAGDVQLPYAQLPAQIREHLPVPAPPFLPEAETYRVIYSKDWADFMVDSLMFKSPDSAAEIIIGGSKRSGVSTPSQKDPLSALKPSLVGKNQVQIYFIDCEGELSAYVRTEDGAIYFIFGQYIDQESFGDLVSKAVS
jgi:hypothetical protein